MPVSIRWPVRATVSVCWVGALTAPHVSGYRAQTTAPSSPSSSDRSRMRDTEHRHPAGDRGHAEDQADVGRQPQHAGAPTSRTPTTTSRTAYSEAGAGTGSGGGGGGS